MKKAEVETNRMVHAARAGMNLTKLIKHKYRYLVSLLVLFVGFTPMLVTAVNVLLEG